jgi:poly-gamma-glutamate capsule biosynthesis protein CapA/YwtB (metallophosphatase superfamily)
VTIKVALAGDTMLGRGVGERLTNGRPTSLFAPAVVEVAREADLFVLNLECCISDRGSPWPAPGKPFFFRAPPVAVEALTYLGVDCVTLANNHALDFGDEALLDTLRHLREGGIACVGAGPAADAARLPVVIESDDGFRLAVVGFCDHPADFAAGPDHPGVAFADLRTGVPDWLTTAIGAIHADAILVSPHWGPNMTAEPVDPVRRAAPALVAAGASLVAGHSAHVFHGVDGKVLYDLGGFIDDYATDPVLRNDLGLLFLVTFDRARPMRLEAVPLKLEFCFTTLAEGDEARWIGRRFLEACVAFGTEVTEEEGRLLVDWR